MKYLIALLTAATGILHLLVGFHVLPGGLGPDTKWMLVLNGVGYLVLLVLFWTATGNGGIIRWILLAYTLITLIGYFIIYFIIGEGFNGGTIPLVIKAIELLLAILLLLYRGTRPVAVSTRPATTSVTPPAVGTRLGESTVDLGTDVSAATAATAARASAELDRAGDTVADTADRAGDAVADAYDATTDAASDAADYVGDRVGAAYDATTDAASDAADYVGDRVGAAYDATTDAASDAADYVGDRVEDAYDATADAAGAIGDQVEAAYDATTDAASDAADAIGDRVEAAYDTTVEAVSDAADAAGDAADAAGDSIRGGAVAAGTAAGSVMSSVGDAVDEAESEGDDLIDELREYFQTSFGSGSEYSRPIEYIEGVGAVYGQKLRAIDINTVLDLIVNGATRRGRKNLSDRSGISQSLILTWVNHVDLFRIKGVAQEYADLLEESGVDTVVELAQRNPGNLHKRMIEVNDQKALVRRTPHASEVQSWVEQAKQLRRVIHY